MAINPFHELYVGERISSEEFVAIFSTLLVAHATPLFLPGNVVLSGVQGSGKSMLFKLLKPEVRQEYAKARQEFPIPPRLRRFLGAGINVNNSNATDFGLRALPDNQFERAAMFGDFFNYVVCADLIDSLRVVIEGDPVIADELGVHINKGSEKLFLQNLTAKAVWNGSLEGISSLEALREAFSRRIAHYRHFLHANVDEVDEGVRRSKTPIGEAVAALVHSLRAAEIIAPDLNVFVHVDQYEELGTVPRRVASDIDYRAVVNRALSKRDPTISYRVGTRGYAWQAKAFIFGTDAKLEQERDYKLIDLDSKLRRYEDRSPWIFPDFARDVFARRIRNAEFSCPSGSDESLLSGVFGRSIPPEQKAELSVKTNRGRVLKMEATWPRTVHEVLTEVAERNPLSARLGESWVRQKGAEELSGTSSLPWEDRSAEWWRKERVELSLLQIASTSQQRPLWSGEDEVIALSGGNILVFLSICQFIWDIATQARQGRGETPEIPIPPQIQSIGIFRASEHWLNKILQETGSSSDRHRFVRYIGQKFSRDLLTDRKLSNPGHNGFSLAQFELDQDEQVKSLLIEAGEYGNLVMLPHTTKERDRKPRLKWYLGPIYCPFLRMPYNRPKEPRYVKVDDVVGWLIDAGIRPDDGKLRQSTGKKKAPSEAPLLDGLAK